MGSIVVSPEAEEDELAHVRNFWGSKGAPWHPGGGICGARL